MLAHAASSSALPCPLVSRPVSRQSRLGTLVFPGKTGGFAAEVVGFELSARFYYPWLGCRCLNDAADCRLPKLALG